MRLIDVDFYCATICRCNRIECDKANCPIHNAPTAYDVNKVVEELEELTFNADVNIGDDGTTMNNDLIASKNAIKIVKQGGVSDNVCEWKQTSTARYRTSCGYKLQEYFDTNACYCKQCGKKIKVVE